MRALFPKKLSKGLTLVELSIVVGIAGVLLSLTVVGATSVFASTRAEAEIDELSATVMNIQRSYAKQNSFQAVTQPLLLALKVFPASRVNGTTVLNRWDGHVTAAPATVTTSFDSVALTSTDIPSEECAHMVRGVEHMMKEIRVNTTVVKTATQFSAEPGALNTACQAGVRAAVTFTFGK